MEQEERYEKNWFIDNFNEIQNLSLLENALAMNNLHEYKKQKWKYTLKWLYVKNKEAFIRKFKERFDNDKAVLKNFIRIYLKTNKLWTIDDNRGETTISNVWFCGSYIKIEVDINYGFLEGEGVEGT